jgi:alpha-N-acetylglucosaminidase
MSDPPPDSAQLTAALELVERLVGDRATTVRVELTSDAQSGYTVAAADGILRVRATDGVAVASALRHYAAVACELELAAPGDRLPEAWPDLASLSRATPWMWRYHLNYCTFGYSTAFWDWPRWEQEIDWMAMSGVNLPLATVGFEGVWLEVLTDFGMTSTRAREYLGSAAFLPWAWMGCLHDHGAPMSEAEIGSRVELGRRILLRQRALGMTPVLPGFAGYLPPELAGENARSVDWMGFANRCVAPGDPRYREFGLALLATQRELFGSDGVYAVDPFVEGRPPVDEPAEVAAYATAIADVLTTHDPQSTWVLQSWPFSYRADYWDRARTGAFLGAMPPGRSLVLDLWAEHDPMWQRTQGFAGLPWVWAMLHSFGGRPGLYGALDVISTSPDDASRASAGASLKGIGTAMESLGSDPIVYELFADVAWSGRVDDLHGWLRARVRRRYGPEHWSLVAAWSEIVRICYREGRQPGPPVSSVMSRPRLDGDLSPARPLNMTSPSVSVLDLQNLSSAWGALVLSARARGSSEGLDRDIVEVGLDVLARLAAVVQRRAVDEFQAGDRAALEQTAGLHAGILAAMDRLARTSADFRLDDWIRRARSWGETAERADDFECDAKLLLTCWAEPGHVLEDYAGRHWAGLIDGYYAPRWQSWFDALLGAQPGQPLDADSFARQLNEFEHGWLTSPYWPAQKPPPPPEPVGPAAEAARELVARELGSHTGGRQNAGTRHA